MTKDLYEKFAKISFYNINLLANILLKKFEKSQKSTHNGDNRVIYNRVRFVENFDLKTRPMIQYIGESKSVSNSVEVNSNNILVWGANIDNFNLENDAQITGEAAIGKQIPGIFGIVSTHLNVTSENLKKLIEPRKCQPFNTEKFYKYNLLPKDLIDA